MRRILGAIFLMLTLIGCTRKIPTPSLGSSQSTFADYYPHNPMVHQVGKTLVGIDGNPLRLRGVNLGGWLLWEGGNFGKAILLPESVMLYRLAQIVGNQAAQNFRNQIHANYVTETDFQRIAELGFNSVRLPINANLLEDDARPYVYKQSGWNLIERALNWGEKYNVYILIDLHAVPGGQSRLSPSDPGPVNEIIWQSNEHRQRTIAMWQAIANRYKDRKIIAGYDLINEPLPPKPSALFELEQDLVAAIRQVDRQHLIIIEGDKFSSDFSMFAKPLSGNQMYGFHMYNWFGDDRKKKIAGLNQLALAQNVPLWAGEFGENTYDMIASTVEMYDDPQNHITGGWSFWNWKKVSTRWPTLMNITPPDGWQTLLDWLSSPKKDMPDRETTLTLLNQFAQATRLENNVLDQQMLNALKLTRK